jgi:hypothetical protein
LQRTLREKEEEVMAQVIIKGQVYTIYEMNPYALEDQQIALIKREVRKKEKHTRERDWKQMARQNYRKK